MLDEPRTSAPADAAMERYAAGDDTAFGAVYDALAGRLYGYLRRHVADPQARDDLLQETFLRMHRARGTFVNGAQVVPWAFAIARRLVIDHARGERRAPRIADAVEPEPTGQLADAERPEQTLEARQLAQRMTAALGRLPDSQRTAFELLKQDGLTLAEAAAVLGTTTAAVKLRAHRAYESLRAVLGEDAPV